MRCNPSSSLLEEWLLHQLVLLASVLTVSSSFMSAPNWPCLRTRAGRSACLRQRRAQAGLSAGHPFRTACCSRRESGLPVEIDSELECLHFVADILNSAN